MPEPMLARLYRIELLRYLAASIVALAADGGSYLAGLVAGVAALPASVLSYTIGIGVHWTISSRAVFAGVAREGTERIRQKALFVASALVGLAITATIVGMATHVGCDPRLSKLLAVGTSFMATWTLRSRVVFVSSLPA